MAGLQDILGALRDPQFRKDIGQGTLDALNRGIVGGTLGGPADLANTVANLGKAGYGALGKATGLLKTEDMPELNEHPRFGSEWWGQKMQDAGMVSGNRNPVAETVSGAALGPLSGASLAERSPQIAAAMLRAGENLRAPREPGLGAMQAGKVRVADDEHAVRQAPAIWTSTSGDDLPMLPREGGMYDPSVPQADLPRQQGRGGKYTERMQALLDDPKVARHLDTLIAKGYSINPDLQEWYGTYPLKQAFANERGGLQDWDRFRSHLASASQRNPVPKQNQQGSFLWMMDEQGHLQDPNVRLLTNALRKAEGATPAGPLIELPESYGSLAQGAIFDRAKQLAQRKPIDEVLDPSVKLGSFGHNLGGNLRPVTVDVNAMKGPTMMARDPRWLKSQLVEKDDTGNVIARHRPREDYNAGRLSMDQALERPGFWEDAPSGSEYQGFEDLWTRAANRAGVHPAEGQALGWYGSADVTDLKSPPEQYIQNIERMARRRAAETGQRPMQVLTDMLRGKGHLAVGGAGAGLAAAAGMQDDDVSR